jgi:hypothetical protein
MNLGSIPVVPSGDTLLNTLVGPGRAGTQAWSRDGRRFRLVKAGAAALARGVLVRGYATNTGHLVMAPSVDVPIGAAKFAVVAGPGAGTNAPANTYAGGLAIVSTGPGQAQVFAVKSHDAIVATAAFTIVLESDESVQVALTAAASKIDLIANPYLGVVLTDASAAIPSGVTVGPIDANAWGMVQVEGLAAGLSDGAIAIGQAVSPSAAVGGAFVINSTTLPVIGVAVQAGVAARTFGVSLSLP